MAAFTGCGTALITPFQKDGSLDEECFRTLVRRQIEGGIDFLVPCGTTGESPTLSHAEHLRVVEMTLEEAQGKVPVLGGAGGYATQKVIELARELQAMGVDGLLSVTPYYNKPTQEGLYQHYKAIAASVKIPIVVYSVQGRTGVNVEPATMKRIAALDNIYGVKEASGMMGQITRICSENEGLVVLSGDDILTQAVEGVGGKGVVSVLSNVVPNFYRDAKAGGRPLLYWIALMDALFIEANPIPVKAAMAAMGLCLPVWRLPLVPPQEATTEKLLAVLRSYALLKSQTMVKA